MKKIIFIIILCLSILITAEVYSNILIPTSKEIPGYVTPSTSEVFIGARCIEMPLNKIALVRYEGKHYAVKFIRFWHEPDKNGVFSKYASYEVYYQKDGSGDFIKQNVKYSDGIASWLPLCGPVHQLLWQSGKPYIRCGSLALLWEYQGFLCFSMFNKQTENYDIELAPTPWESVSEINVKHPRIKWLKCDKTRKGRTITIEQFWGDSTNNKDKSTQ